MVILNHNLFALEYILIRFLSYYTSDVKGTLHNFK